MRQFKFIFLLLTGLLHGQSSLLLTGAGSPVSYDAEAAAYFNRMSTQPDGAVKKAISDFFKGVKSDEGITSLSQRFNAMYFFGSAIGSTVNAAVNMVSASYSITAVNTSSTLAWGKAGYQTINNSYLNTNWTSSTDGGTVFTLNSGAVGAYVIGNTQNDGSLWGSYGVPGGFDGLYYVIKRLTSNNVILFLNNSGTGATANTGNVDGFQYAARTGASTVKVYQKGSLKETLTTSSSALSTLKFYILAANGNGAAAAFTDKQIPFVSIGSDSVNAVAFAARVETLMKALGCSYTQVKKVYTYGNSNEVGTNLTNNLYRYSKLISMGYGFYEVNNGVSGSTFQHAVPVDYYGAPNFQDAISSVPTYSASRDTLVFIGDMLNDARAYDAGQTNYSAANYSVALAKCVDTLIINRGWPANRIVIVPGFYVNTASTFPNGTLSNYLLGFTYASSVATAKGTRYVDAYSYLQTNGGLSNLGDAYHLNNTGHANFYTFYRTLY